MKSKQLIKEQLFRHCADYAAKHLEIVTEALEKTQDATSDESKNSAGDKYETGRAMKQREAELFGHRVNEAMELQKVLDLIDISTIHEKVEAGALVETSLGTFFIAIAADEIEIDGTEYCPISVMSPIGQALLNHKAKEVSEFRGKIIEITNVF